MGVPGLRLRCANADDKKSGMDFTGQLAEYEEIGVRERDEWPVFRPAGHALEKPANSDRLG